MSDEAGKPQKAVKAIVPAVESLWPEKLQTVRRKPPVTILKEQAALLGKMTRNVIRGEVLTLKKEGDDRLSYVFIIIAPALDNYRLWLFAVRQKPTELYPLIISSNELRFPGKDPDGWEVKDEEDFKEALKQLFAHPKTMNAIEALTSQSGDPTPKEPDMPF